MYFIGIDIGKTVNMACRLGRTEKFLEFKNTERGISKFKEWLPKGNSRVLVEATGGYHYPIVWDLINNGYDVKIINPMLAHRKKIVSLRAAKTDAIDAHSLAELARDGKGTSWIPTQKCLQHRILGHAFVAVRDCITQQKVRTQRMRELWMSTDDKIPKWLNEDILKGLNEFKKKLENLLEDYGDPLIHRLATIPGVSKKLASLIIAETGSFERFGYIQDFVAYCGLDPSIRQSGGKPQRYGKLSKRGSPVLRTTLFQCAMGAWRTSYFRQIYDHHKARQRSFREVLCIIARKIARISYSLAKSPNAVFSEFNHLTRHT